MTKHEFTQLTQITFMVCYECKRSTKNLKNNSVLLNTHLYNFAHIFH